MWKLSILNEKGQMIREAENGNIHFLPVHHGWRVQRQRRSRPAAIGQAADRRGPVGHSDRGGGNIS
jgi:hypothetical protein